MEGFQDARVSHTRGSHSALQSGEIKSSSDKDKYGGKMSVQRDEIRRRRKRTSKVCCHEYGRV